MYYVYIDWNGIICGLTKREKDKIERLKRMTNCDCIFTVQKENMELCIAFYSNLNHIEEKNKCNDITIIYLNNNRIYIT